MIFKKKTSKKGVVAKKKAVGRRRSTDAIPRLTEVSSRVPVPDLKGGNKKK